MKNPFRLNWLKEWNFQIVLMEGGVKIEAHGYGICLQTNLEPGESPRSAADRLVLTEDRRRKALRNSWTLYKTTKQNNYSAKIQRETEPVLTR